MDHKGITYLKKTLGISALFIAIALVSSINVFGQSSSYQLLPAPDIWYNSVDGIRLGIRVKGQRPGTFEDGPHRLNAGFWVGTNIPTHPVSYYISFIEPIPSMSAFQSEASIKLHSSYRTGFQDHGISFNKRWQTGFDEKNYTELSVGFRSEHRFDNEYLLYDQLWQNRWLYLAHLHLKRTNKTSVGRYVITYRAAANLGGNYPGFFRTEISAQQSIKIAKDFTFIGRIYSGFASKNTAPEYLFSHSLVSARDWMDNGLTRARGTIPPVWMQSGSIQIAGGANLRGYLHQDIKSLNNGLQPLFTSISSVNMEMTYPNPIDHALAGVPIIGKFLKLQSYVFFDGGTSLGLTKYEEPRSLFDAGPGFLFSLNIPDYLGKPRGLLIRYDLPLWLSKPGPEKSFKFRNVIGLGAVISL